MSIKRYLAPRGTAGFARSLVKDMVNNNFPDCLSRSILAIE
jgi:hypothetical protein